MTHYPTRPDWDIFCTVIDNFGDIGVTWRLAKNLQARAQTVRLWVDDLAAFHCLCPEVKPCDVQCIQGIEIRQWQATDGMCPAKNVIAAFGCNLPAAIQQAMLHTKPAPHWINLEYLSAETWVEDCHGLPSWQGPLVQYFFFPGFSPATGGLLQEPDLTQRIQQWQADPGRQQLFWAQWDLALPQAAEKRISLFCYENPQIPLWLEAWEQSPTPITLIVPQGRILPQLKARYPALANNACYRQGALTLRIIPMTTQDTYDQLLWSCDLNIVRGEDSFVRAQWAQKPFLWHIYPQDANAHHIKLAAFLTRYTQGLPAEVQANITALFWGLNHTPVPWPTPSPLSSQWQQHARTTWPHTLSRQADLATQLIAHAAQFAPKSSG